MKTSDFYYDLPNELIAQSPIKDRSKSRLMVINRETKSINDDVFENILDYLEQGDALVLNNTKVLPARLFGHRPGKDEKIEVLLIKRVDDRIWETLVKPGKKLKIDVEIEFSSELKGVVKDISPDGSRFIAFSYEGIFEEILDKLGEMPLPPYIVNKLEDKDRYQTIYAKEKGSAAAPTAGLHFTRELLEKIKDKGVSILYLTLHVGIGTFRPVKVDDVKEHKMHSEYYSLDEQTANRLNKIKSKGGKIISVGTTSTRTLETLSDERGIIKAGHGWTDIFIYPGYKFKFVDALITNFHLPESTLLMLVSAFTSKELIFTAYREAVEKKYRFFSFGDAMFIY